MLAVGTGPGDVSTLSERQMSASKLAALAEARQKELQSLFDNCVWSYTSSADPRRTMRARFLLKWRTGEGGQPDAKARLVLQGFRDPDALEGKLETSSPTATRMARQMLFSIASVSDWSLYVADAATAFLQGKPQERVLFVRLPADAAP